MQILGVDFGKKKIGLALADSDSGIAQPYTVFRFYSFEDVLRKIRNVIQLEKIDLLVLGISEARMAKETLEFGKKVRKRLRIPIVFQDETLTSYEARQLSIKAGIRRKKRKKFEDAYSAALILQSYLDEKLAKKRKG